MYNFTEQEIKIANATSRTSGASAINKDGTIRAIVPKYVEEYVDKNKTILDFGAGKGAIHTKYLRDKGFKFVTAYDFGENNLTEMHDINALNKQYDVVFASNVLNVCSSREMIIKTINQIYNATSDGGVFICNYPSSPRKSCYMTNDIINFIESFFNNKTKIIGGNLSSPMLMIKKT